MTTGTTIQLGVQPDGTALVAVWLSPVAAQRWRAELGELPETAWAQRGGPGHRQVFRVPAACVFERKTIGLVAGDGLAIDHDGRLEDFEGGEIAALPARWLSFLITQGILLDTGAFEYGTTTTERA